MLERRCLHDLEAVFFLDGTTPDLPFSFRGLQRAQEARLVSLASAFVGVSRALYYDYICSTC
jgi:hypothetical protein